MQGRGRKQFEVLSRKDGKERGKLQNPEREIPVGGPLI